jgi:hypothetical protein
MTRRIMVLVIATMVALGAGRVFAHDEYRIIGTIVSRQNTKLELKSREGKMVAVKLDGETLVYRDNKKIDVAELKAGHHVVVDALGDSVADLLALEVRIIAALPK